MKGICLRFYMHELQKHHGKLLYEWILESAKKKGIQGGSAFRAIAGYGRHGILHEEHFFELASDVPIEVTFILDAEQVEGFLSDLKRESVDLFYTVAPIEYDFLSSENRSKD